MKLAETFQTRPSGVLRTFGPSVPSTRFSRLRERPFRHLALYPMAAAFDRSTDIAAENGNLGQARTGRVPDYNVTQ